MKPRKPLPEQDELLRARSVEMIAMRHELMKLPGLIDWDVFERERAGFYSAPHRTPPLATGLCYLQHIDALSDEAVVARWPENRYWQHFCGEKFLQHHLPNDPSSLNRSRKRVDEEGLRWMLTRTIDAGKRAGVVKSNELKRVACDSTVVEMNIAHPTAAQPYETARPEPVGLRREAEIGDGARTTWRSHSRAKSARGLHSDSEIRIAVQIRSAA